LQNSALATDVTPIGSFTQDANGNWQQGTTQQLPVYNPQLSLSSNSINVGGSLQIQLIGAPANANVLYTVFSSEVDAQPTYQNATTDGNGNLNITWTAQQAGTYGVSMGVGINGNMVQLPQALFNVNTPTSAGIVYGPDTTILANANTALVPPATTIPVAAAVTMAPAASTPVAAPVTVSSPAASAASPASFMSTLATSPVSPSAAAVPVQGQPLDTSSAVALSSDMPSAGTWLLAAAAIAIMFWAGSGK
jgi:hypothetical protein